MRYRLLLYKNRIENILLFPFILLGRGIASISKNDTEYSSYYFFPFYGVGGAEKVHYLIVQATAAKDSIIYFTRKTKGPNYMPEFEKAGCTIKDISKFTDNKFIYPINFIFRGYISHKINTQGKKPFVFNGQSNFGYKISPWIKKGIPQIDLIHSLNSFSSIRIPFLAFYKQSITVSREIVDKHRNLYLSYGIPLVIIDKLSFIPFGIQLPERKEKTFSPNQLRVLYVGRGSSEKRVHLVANIAKRMANTNVTFSFAGDVKGSVPVDLHPFCNFLGAIGQEKELQQVYEQHDVLLVTSDTESGPLVVLEAMIKGLAVISTPVGIVPDYIIKGKNGFLFSEIFNEEKIIEEGISFIENLNSERGKLESMSKNNIDYAYQTFGMEKFNENYRLLFKNASVK